MKKTLIFLLATFLWSPGAHAATYSGRLTTAIYSFERAFEDTVTTRSFRVYQTGQLKVADLGSRPELSFLTYARVSTDLLNTPSSDPAYRLYHAHLKWSDTQDRYRLTLGRQSVFAGVGVGRIDGLRARVALIRRVRLDVYGGSLVRGGFEGVTSFGSAKLYGGHLIFTDVFGLTAGVSGFRKSRSPEPYASSVRADEGLPSVNIEPDEVEQQMIGFDISRRIGQLTSTSRWDLATPHSPKTRRFESVLRYAAGGWSVSGEFLYRRPYVDQNSVFSVFTQSSNQEFSLRTSKRFNRHLGLFTEISRIDYDGDRSYRINVGANVLNGYVGYARRTGFGGASDGLNGRVVYRLNDRLMTTASLGLTSFRTYSGTGTRSRVLANSIGLTYRAARKVSLMLQGQSLSQSLETTSADRFRGAERDYRVFFTASTWFYHKGGK